MYSNVDMDLGSLKKKKILTYLRQTYFIVSTD